MKRDDRPTTTFDHGLQHERTALAWERTAVAMMVAGLALGKYSALRSAWFLSLLGLVQTAIGAGLLVWTGLHYEQLHGALRHGADVVHPAATRIVGFSTVVCTAAALVLGLLVVIGRRT